MKLLALLSLTLNILLTGIVCFIWSRPQETFQASQPQKIATTAAQVEKVSSKQTPTPFHWSQVESDDYATFTANLRAISCPEETIRHLVAGEIGQIYQDKQKQFEDRAGRPMQPSELRKLRQEQAVVLAQVMPSTSAAEKKNESRNGPSLGSGLVNRGPAPRYPLAFAASSSGKSTALGSAAAPPVSVTPVLSKTVAAVAINQIRQEFVSQIGGTNQNPSDPAYYQRWSKAQRLADDRMRSLMGAEYYNRNSIEAGVNAR